MTFKWPGLFKHALKHAGTWKATDLKRELVQSSNNVNVLPALLFNTQTRNIDLAQTRVNDCSDYWIVFWKSCKTDYCLITKPAAPSPMLSDTDKTCCSHVTHKCSKGQDHRPQWSAGAFTLQEG